MALDIAYTSGVIAVREKYLQLQGDKAYLEQIYKQGAEKACLASRKILRKVYKKIGFIER